MTGLEKMLAINQDQLKEELIKALKLNYDIKDLINVATILSCPFEYGLYEVGYGCDPDKCPECWDIALINQTMGE